MIHFIMRNECHPLKYIVQKTCVYVNYVQIFTCFQIVTHSVSKSWLLMTLLLFWLISRELSFLRKIWKKPEYLHVKYVHVWWVFSLSFTQSVSHGYDIFWLIPREYSFSQRFDKIQTICLFNMFRFDVCSVSFTQSVNHWYDFVHIFAYSREYRFSKKIL